MQDSAKREKLIDRWDILLASLAGILAFALYVRTLAPWVLPGDSGEFQVLSYQVGEAHTTGYPAYVLLSKLFLSLVPIGSIAYRVNLFSAFMGSLTVAGVFLAARLLTRSRLAALFGALALTISFTFWSQAIIAEVYGAGSAFLAAVWVALLLWHRTGNRWVLFTAGFLGGLGLGVHGTIVLLVPPILFFLLLNWRQWKILWRPALAGGLAGAALYLACFTVVDLNAPPANSFNVIYGPARSVWGMSEAETHNPADRIEYLILARQWNGQMFAGPATLMLRHASDYLAGIGREFSIGSFALMIFGLVILGLRDWKATMLFLSALAIHWIFYFNYNVGDIYVFYIPGYFWMAVLAAVGLGGILELAARFARKRGSWIVQGAVFLVAMVFCLRSVWLPHAQAAWEGKVPFLQDLEYAVDERTETNYEAASDAVRGMDKNTIILADWHELWLYWYAASIDQHRNDLRFVEMNPFHQPPNFPQSTLEFIRANIDSHPIYLGTFSPEVWRAGFRLEPVTFGPVLFFKVEAP